MCNHPELLEGHIVCNGDAPSQCRTRLSCQDSCACIVNVECNENIGGKPADGMVRVGSIQDFFQISLAAGIITDKITLHINRKVSTNDSSIEWKAVAEER